MKCKRCGRTIKGATGKRAIKAIGAHYRRFHPAALKRGRSGGKSRRGKTGRRGHTHPTGGYKFVTVTLHD